MPRRHQPMKDAVSCEKATWELQALIRRCPNGETHLPSWAGIRKEGNPGTETSKYPEEEKSNEMPTVASEEGRGQTGGSYGSPGLRTAFSLNGLSELPGKVGNTV